MRVVITIFAVYTGLLVLFVSARQHQLTADINNSIADATTRLIDKNPVDHKKTLFSEILREHVTEVSPHNIKNWSHTSATSGVVTMSPCNPRIKRCG